MSHVSGVLTGLLSVSPCTEIARGQQGLLRRSQIGIVFRWVTLRTSHYQILGSDVESPLKVVHPILREICPLILRARAMISTKDTRKHMALAKPLGALSLLCIFFPPDAII